MPSTNPCNWPAGDGAWPLEHPIAACLAWTAVLLAVFVPLCAARYARPG